MSARPRPSPDVAGAPRDALAALRAEYAQRLPARVHRLARALHALRRAPDDALLLERARALAHRLRGTAGSYGFAAIGGAAGRVEDAIRRAAWDESAAALRDAEALAVAAAHPLAGKEGSA